MREFALIDRIAARLRPDPRVALGIGDDAALLRPPPGEVVVVATDTLVAGVHFPESTAPADIGHKALAVNLSDLAAMGAAPLGFTLSLSLPRIDAAWCDALLDGMLALAGRAGCPLVGGDTTRGPLVLTVTALGSVPEDAALRRDGARAGELVCVTGVLGDAAAALEALGRGELPDAALRARLDRPEPRLAAGLALRGLAGACIDLSDGLLADLGHVCRASGVGARIEAAALPASPGFLAAVPPGRRAALQAAVGDDYELCFTLAPDRVDAAREALAAVGVPLAVVGEVIAGRDVRLVDAEGRDATPAIAGHQHFGDDA